MKAVKSDPDPAWGRVSAHKAEMHSTGVCLNGFFSSVLSHPVVLRTIASVNLTARKKRVHGMS